MAADLRTPSQVPALSPTLDGSGEIIAQGEAYVIQDSSVFPVPGFEHPKIAIKTEVRGDAVAWPVPTWRGACRSSATLLDEVILDARTIHGSLRVGAVAYVSPVTGPLGGTRPCWYGAANNPPPHAPPKRAPPMQVEMTRYVHEGAHTYKLLVKVPTCVLCGHKLPQGSGEAVWAGVAYAGGGSMRWPGLMQLAKCMPPCQSACTLLIFLLTYSLLLLPHWQPRPLCCWQ